MPNPIESNDNDSLHVLPLSLIPLEINALKKTRLIKNTRLEGLLELYSEASIGSGQVALDDLETVFDFSGGRAKDLMLIKKLSALHSYDVYSLRVSLRRLKIEVDNIEGLKLSAEMADSLSEHMSAFTRPLILKIYGHDDLETTSFRDVLLLFTDPNADAARDNLRALARSLDIQLIDIPKFLETYADVFLSLSFFQKCHDITADDLAHFLDDLRALQSAVQGKATNDIQHVANQISGLHGDVANIMEMFRTQTEDMWQNISAERYQKMSRLITEHQEKIGANLCAITVKLNAWKQLEFSATTDSVSDKVGFVTREIGHGLDRLTGLDFQDI